MNYYLIGIKGTGLSALAKVLKDLGENVYGSDTNEYYFTVDNLDANNIKYQIFSEDNITDEYIYIISNAYNKDNNVEVRKVINEGYRYFYYQDFIEYYFRKNKIGVSGTHGKTTTTAMLAKFLEDEHISYLIGDSNGLGIKNHQYFVFEACEYKNHFLSYQYQYLIINNIDYDHPDFYTSLEQTLESFQGAAYLSEHLIINNDDENSKKITHHNKTTFGKSIDSDVVLKEYLTHSNGYDIVIEANKKTYHYYLPFTGEHMLYNFLSSFTLLYVLDKIPNDLQQKLLTFKLPKRRMEELNYYSNIIIDDYAHHPYEIKCLLQAVKQKYPSRKIVAIFQPHTYSRTLALKNEFQNAFTLADELYIAPTFASARESKDLTKEQIVLEIFSKAKKYTKDLINQYKNYHNTVILYIGAGNISEDIKRLY